MNWCSHCGKPEVSYDPAVPLLGKYPKTEKATTGSQRDTCTPVFVTALVTTAGVWEQAECLPTDG